MTELVNLRNGTLGGGKAVKVTPGAAHLVTGTGAPADASTSDVVVNITVPTTAGNTGPQSPAVDHTGLPAVFGRFIGLIADCGSFQPGARSV